MNGMQYLTKSEMPTLNRLKDNVIEFFSKLNRINTDDIFLKFTSHLKDFVSFPNIKIRYFNLNKYSLDRYRVCLLNLFNRNFLIVSGRALKNLSNGVYFQSYVKKAK